jgi:hypothetical protein
VLWWHTCRAVEEMEAAEEERMLEGWSEEESWYSDDYGYCCGCEHCG